MWLCSLAYSFWDDCRDAGDQLVVLQVFSEEQAAIRIQAGVRGLLNRGALARQQEEEGRFLGMLLQVSTVPGLRLSGSSGVQPLLLVLLHAKHPVAPAGRT